MAKRIVSQETWVAPDFVPETFGRLTTISSKYKPKASKWALTDYACTCGKQITAIAAQVKFGTTASCGCLRSEMLAAKNKKNARHGYFGSRTYCSWTAMICRCEDPTHEAYHNYGGRGIKVFPSWRADFVAFLNCLGERPLRKTLDRIDPNGNYEPGNVRWATTAEQASNRRNNVILTYDGLSLTVSEWSRRFGFEKSCLGRRIKAGWSVADALTTPPGQKRATLT